MTGFDAFNEQSKQHSAAATAAATVTAAPTEFEKFVGDVSSMNKKNHKTILSK